MTVDDEITGLEFLDQRRIKMYYGADAHSEPLALQCHAEGRYLKAYLHHLAGWRREPEHRYYRLS